MSMFVIFVQHNKWTSRFRRTELVLVRLLSISVYFQDLLQNLGRVLYMYTFLEVQEQDT